MHTATKTYSPLWTPVSDAGITEAALDRIRSLALTDVDPDRLYVRRMKLCNDQYDRSHERFPVNYLRRFEATLPGKSFLDNHQNEPKKATRQAILGRFYDATLEKDAKGVTHLIPSVYMVKTAENEALRENIDYGIYGHCSIGFKFDQLVCDVCNQNYHTAKCQHSVGQKFDGRVCRTTYGGDEGKAEAVEGSLVYLGCQTDATFVKSAGGLFTPMGDHLGPWPDKARWLAENAWRRTHTSLPSGPSSPNPQSAIRNPQSDAPTPRFAPASEARPQTPEAPMQGIDPRYYEAAKAAYHDASNKLDAADGYIKSLEHHVTEITPLAEDGQLYRADLLEEAARLAGILKSEKQLDAIMPHLARANADQLKAFVEEMAVKVEELMPPQPVARPIDTPVAAAETPRTTRRPHALI